MRTNTVAAQGFRFFFENVKIYADIPCDDFKT